MNCNHPEEFKQFKRVFDENQVFHVFALCYKCRDVVHLQYKNNEKLSKVLYTVDAYKKKFEN